MKYKHVDLLAKEILEFTVDVMKASDQAERDPRETELFNQLIRVLLAAGASYRWGRRASKKREFVNRLRVAQAEFEELITWLGMVADKHSEPVWPRSLAIAQNINQILIASLAKARQPSQDNHDE